MKVLGWVIVVVLGLLLGLLISLSLNGISGLGFRLSENSNIAQPISTNKYTPANKITPSPFPISTLTNSQDSNVNLPQPTAISPKIELGEKKATDVQDVLLLYDSANSTSFAINFCKIAEFYGLLCKKVDLRSNLLSNSLLYDPSGSYFRLVGVDAPAILQHPSLLEDEEITTLKDAVDGGGVNLLVGKVDGTADTDTTFLGELTDGAILGVATLKSSQHDWIVSGAVPELTREFTGQIIKSASPKSLGGSALLVNKSSVTPVISTQDSAGATLPVFVRWKKEAGAIYIDSGQSAESLDRLILSDVYYDPARFSQIIPLMMTIRATMGNEVWHSDRHFANLTIDDPTLLEPFKNLSYINLLREMLVHNYHTTIAYIPANWEETQSEVVSLFLNYPDMFSLVQKGNNADGYEFYKYQVSSNDENPEYPARPLPDQEWDIKEGLARMGLLKNRTELPFERIMIFPDGISPAQTLQLLKEQDYLATVNEQDVPLGSTRPADWDYGMYPAILNYKSFPLLVRQFLGVDSSANPDIQQSVFDLFLNKPALYYSSADEEGVFADGVGGFNSIADRINLLPGVEWQSLGTILKNLYLEKTNDDGSVDIRMFTRTLILENKTRVEQTYHITKQEDLNAPISSLTVNGQPFSFDLQNNQLALDMKIPAKASVQIQIHYLQP